MKNLEFLMQWVCDASTHEETAYRLAVYNAAERKARSLTD